MTEKPHVYFEAEQSARGWAIYYDPRPVDLGDGRTRYGLRFPIVLATEMLKAPDAVLPRIAELLNKHWDIAPEEGEVRTDG